MTVLNGLILAFSALAAALACLALTRSAPARVLKQCELALQNARAAGAEVEQLRSEWQGKRAEMNTILEAVEDERERAQKDRARARAERQRAEQTAGNGPPQPESRAELLARLRRESGLLSGV